MTITTTLNHIRDKKPCAPGWQKLLAGLGKTRANNKPLQFARILEINGIDDAIWCMRAEPQHAKEWRIFAVWCVRQVEHLLTDKRALDALDVAERHAYGLATNEELAAAWTTAWIAASDATRGTRWGAAAARAAALNAVRGSASEAAREAARGATWAAARDATWSAARADASEAATEAAWSAARAATLVAARGDTSDAAINPAWHAARAAQKVKLLEITGGK